MSEFDYTVQFRNKRPADILAAVAQQPFPMAVFPASSTFTCCVVSFEHSDRIIEKVGGIAVAFQFYSSHGLSLHLYEDGEYKGRIVVDASVLDVPDFAITPKNRHGMDREAWKGLLSEEQLDTVESRLDDDHHALAAFIAEALGIDRYRNLSPDDLEYGPEGLREQGATLRL